MAAASLTASPAEPQPHRAKALRREDFAVAKFEAHNRRQPGALRADTLPRHPALKLRHPGRYRGRLWAAAVLDRFMNDHGLSSTYLAAESGLNERSIDKMRSGEKPFEAGDVIAILPRRTWAMWSTHYGAALLEFARSHS